MKLIQIIQEEIQRLVEDTAFSQHYRNYRQDLLNMSEEEFLEEYAKQMSYSYKYEDVTCTVGKARNQLYMDIDDYYSDFNSLSPEDQQKYKENRKRMMEEIMKEVRQEDIKDMQGMASLGKYGHTYTHSSLMPLGSDYAKMVNETVKRLKEDFTVPGYLKRMKGLLMQMPDDKFLKLYQQKIGVPVEQGNQMLHQDTGDPAVYTFDDDRYLANKSKMSDEITGAMSWDEWINVQDFMKGIEQGGPKTELHPKDVLDLMQRLNEDPDGPDKDDTKK